MPARARSRRLRSHRCIEIDDDSVRHEVAAIVSVEHRAPARRDNDALERRQFAKDITFAAAETCFALAFENEANICSGACLDDRINVIERAAEYAGEFSPDCALARAHGANQKEVVRRGAAPPHDYGSVA